MAANNESGVVQPWMELARLCSEYNVPFHCDATQWVGKMPISDLRFCSSFTASAHKFGGPKGVGWLVDQNFNRMQVGGSQEGGRRAGTENFPSIMAMGKAWEQSQSNYKSIPKHALWRDHFEKEVLLQISGTRIIGRNTDRLWNTSLLLMPRFDNLKWVSKLDTLGFEVSTGSACSSGSTTLSGTAASFGLDLSEAKYLLRISSYFGHTEKDWISLGEAMVEAYEQMKSESHKFKCYFSLSKFELNCGINSEGFKSVPANSMPEAKKESRRTTPFELADLWQPVHQTKHVQVHLYLGARQKKR